MNRRHYTIMSIDDHRAAVLEWTTVHRSVAEFENISNIVPSRQSVRACAGSSAGFPQMGKVRQVPVNKMEKTGRGGAGTALVNLKLKAYYNYVCLCYKARGNPRKLLILGSFLAPNRRDGYWLLCVPSDRP
jgi:hypothetical protein